MKILFIADNKEIQEIVSFQITSKFDVSVKEAPNPKEGFELIKNSGDAFSLLVSPYYGPESILAKLLRDREKPLPVIFYYDPAILNPSESNLTGIKCLGMVEKATLTTSIDGLIQNFINSQGEGGEDSREFCPIRTTLLIRTAPLKSDIYIRLSNKKYIKLFHSGEKFDAKDLEKYYQTKGVEYMYLKQGETKEFLSHFTKDLDALLNNPDLSLEEADAVIESTQEALHGLIHTVGFTEEVQEIAKKNVDLTLKAFGKNPKLSSLLDKIKGEGNYINQHSTLLAQVCCCIAKEMEWGSEASFSKLVLASYMHDISLINPELAKVSTLKELELCKAKFKPEEVSSYHLHPAKSADVVKSFQEIPADVDSIVLQHHELPNGAGFPRGLTHNYIAPLAVVFIIAHEMVKAVLEQKDKFSLPKFVSDKRPFFNQGNFKKVMIALEKVNI